MQEESYLNPTLLVMSLPFGLYPDRTTLRLLERDFRMPVKAAVLMAPIQTDFRGGGRPALLYTGRKGQLITLDLRSEEHTSELQSLMRISYAVFCLKKKNN